MSLEQETPIERHGVVFALWDGKHIQLEKRLQGDFEGFIIIPGGGVEEGESPDTAEFQEIAEEYGVILKRSTYLGSYTEESPNLRNTRYVFLVTEWSGKLSNPEGKNEHLEATLEEAFDMCKNPLTQIFLNMVQKEILSRQN